MPGAEIVATSEVWRNKMGELVGNLMLDFILHRTMDGTETEWKFRFGKCESFETALRTVKSIPFAEREYDPELNHLWKIYPSPENEEILRLAFKNFKSNLATARAQLPLF